MINPAPVMTVTEMTQTDKEHIEACLVGQTEEFRHLVRRYERAVFAYLRGRLRDPDRAEDALQETFVRAFFNLAKLKKRESFFPWLLGIAHHVAREADRREQTDRIMSAEYTKQKPRLVEAGAASRDAALEAAVASLPAPLRDVILLRFYSDCSCLQICERLDLRLGTVTKRLSRAYALIRKLIEEQRSSHARPRN